LALLFLQDCRTLPNHRTRDGGGAIPARLLTHGDAADEDWRARRANPPGRLSGVVYAGDVAVLTVTVVADGSELGVFVRVALVATVMLFPGLSSG
jgi:hypothetical protein